MSDWLGVTLRELSLFSGAGGGLLGTKLLGWETIGYVEWNEYCQQVIAQRIKDGILDEAPIFSDLRAFTSEGFAEQYKGMVDVITAGFPCQPFSVAGKGRGEADERNMWPATVECIDAVRPTYVFLENVPRLFNLKYIGTIFRDLAALGYDARWCCLSAAEVGGRHKRARQWILAYSPGIYVQGCKDRQGERQLGRDFRWMPEPTLDRVAYGVAHGVDRLKAIGNGQVPQVVATVWRILSGGYT